MICAASNQFSGGRRAHFVKCDACELANSTWAWGVSSTHACEFTDAAITSLDHETALITLMLVALSTLGDSAERKLFSENVSGHRACATTSDAPLTY